MVKINFLIIAAAAFIPLVMGFLWYNPKTFGTAWMKASGVTPETATGKGMNMGLVFVLTYLCSFFAGFIIQFLVIHQFSVGSVLMNEPGIMEKGSEMNNYLTDFMSKYGDRFRTFKHGALHGTMGGLFLVTPIIAVNAMFERKGFKYIAINGGFWIVNMALMGGVICAFS
ncbi:MAG: hypothetical protein JWP12_2745 [Bacteroidetes bacterium]|nr:hypothetical protein [Bacteroidota bacterium]